MNDELKYKLKVLVDYVKLSNQSFAFAGTESGLCLVYKGVVGYFPVVEDVYASEDYLANCKLADEVNAELLGLSSESARALVLGSMFGGANNV